MAQAWAERRRKQQEIESDSEEEDGEDNSGADPSALRHATEAMLVTGVLTKDESEEVLCLLRRGRVRGIILIF